MLGQYGCLVDQPYLLGKRALTGKKTRDRIFLPTCMYAFRVQVYEWIVCEYMNVPTWSPLGGWDAAKFDINRCHLGRVECVFGAICIGTNSCQVIHD